MLLFRDLFIWSSNSSTSAVVFNDSRIYQKSHYMILTSTFTKTYFKVLHVSLLRPIDNISGHHFLSLFLNTGVVQSCSVVMLGLSRFFSYHSVKWVIWCWEENSGLSIFKKLGKIIFQTCPLLLNWNSPVPLHNKLCGIFAHMKITRLHWEQ